MLLLHSHTLFLAGFMPELGVIVGLTQEVLHISGSDLPYFQPKIKANLTYELISLSLSLSFSLSLFLSLSLSSLFSIRSCMLCFFSLPQMVSPLPYSLCLSHSLSPSVLLSPFLSPRLSSLYAHLFRFSRLILSFTQFSLTYWMPER